MADTVDRLDIEIQAQAASAVAEVDKLYDSLARLADVLNASAGAFGTAKTAIQGTARAMRSLAKINLPNLTTITQQLGDLSQMNFSGADLGSAMANASSGFAALEDTSSEAGRSMSAMTPVVKGIETAFRGLVKTVELVAHGIGNVAGFMVSNFTTIGHAASALGKVRSLMSGILGPLIGFYGVRSLVTLGKDAVELASDLTEVQNVVDHAFGVEGAKAVEDFVSTSKEQYGLAELAAKQYSSRFQAMGKSMGITTDMVAKAHDNVRDHMVKAYQDTGDEMSAMALNLTKLTADMSSFYNEDQQHVAQALQSVFTGQTRSLRQYGIDLTQVNLQEWAAKQGIDAKIDSMTQAEKAMLRYQYIMAQTAMVQGDFARTADTWANQIRLLKQNFQTLGATIGSVVINAFKPLITWLNAAMTKVIAFAETIANALGKIFGWTIKGTAGGGGDAGMGDLAGGLGDVGDAADGAGKSLGGANEKAEELKRTLLGFDEINKLNAPTEGSSGSGGSGGGGSGGGGGGAGGGATAGDFQLVQTDSILDKFKSSIGSLYELGDFIGDTISDALSKIEWDEVFLAAQSFGAGLASFLNGLISPELFGQLGIFIANAINTVLNAENTFLDVFSFKNLGKSLAAGINRFFETFDFGLEAKVFYKSVNGIARAIRFAAEDIEWGEIGSKISECVKSALEGIKWKEEVFPAVDNVGTGLANFLNGLIDEETFGKIGESVGNVLNSSLRFLNTWGTTFEWDKFGISLAAGFRSFIATFDFKMTAQNFTTFATGILSSASAAIGNIDWLDLGYKIRNAILMIDWKIVFASVGDFIVKALNAVIDLAGGLFDLTKFSNGVKALVEALLPAGSGFASGFVAAFSGLADIGAGVLNGIGLAFQVIANALNKLDPEILKGIGIGLGVIAASLVVMKIATGVAGIITSIAGALGLAGLSGGASAAGIAGATAAISEGATVIGGATVATMITRLKLLAGGFLLNVGASVDFTQKIKHALETDDRNAFVGLINSMSVLKDKGVITGNQFNELYGYMNSNETKGKSLADVAYTLGVRLGAAGVSVSQLNKNQSALSGVMDTVGVKGEKQETIFAKLAQGIEETDKWCSTVSSSGFGKLSRSFDDVGKKAEGADEKTGQFGTGVVGFVGGIVGQTITMALMGTAYKNIGDKASAAQSPIDGLKTKITELVSSISTNAATAKTESKTLATNVTDTFTKTIEDAAHTVPNAADTGLVLPVLSAVRDGYGMHSPSTVMRDFGTNINQGLANGITGSTSLVTTAMGTLVSLALQTARSQNASFRSAGTKLATELRDGLKGVTMPSLGDAVKSAMGDYTNHGSNNPFYTLGARIADAFKQGLKSVAAELRYEPAGTTKVTAGGKVQTVAQWNAVWRAQGGFPNYGEVFIANEAGPEMIGKFGNKNVVANNQQITEGIKSAVIDGMMQVAMSGAFGGGNADGAPYRMEVTVKTQNDEVLARAVQRGQLRRNARYTPGFSNI